MEEAKLKWFKIRFFLSNWKQGIHFVFWTKRFGVNNKWWSGFDSIFGVSIWKRLYWIVTVKRLIFNYKYMKLRATNFGLIPLDICKKLGWKEQWGPLPELLVQKKLKDNIKKMLIGS